MQQSKVIAQTYEWLKTAGQKFGGGTEEDRIKIVNFVRKLVNDELDEIIDIGIKKDNPKEELNGISDAFVCLSNLPYLLGFTLTQVEQENEKVFESNSTKFCKTWEEAANTQIHYLNGTHPNKPGETILVNIHETGDKEWPYVVKTPSGKIMKSINFQDVK